MTQAELTREVARATGESVAEIRHMGFSIADPDEPRFDPEADAFNRYVDWDALDLERFALAPC